MGLGQLNQANLHPARHEFKRRPTQLNPSPIQIRISACTLVSIFGITFGSDVQSRWFKLGWKVNLKGYKFTKSPNSVNGPKLSVKWSLKIWDFLQTGIQLVIGFLNLFKGSLEQNSGRLLLGLRVECIESCGYLFHDS